MVNAVAPAARPAKLRIDPIIKGACSTSLVGIHIVDTFVMADVTNAAGDTFEWHS